MLANWGTITMPTDQGNDGTWGPIVNAGVEELRLRTVDLLNGITAGFRPASGGYQQPSTMGGVTSGAITAGVMYSVPIDVMRTATYDALAVNVTTAESGGSTSCLMGLYADDVVASRPRIGGTYQIIAGTAAAFTSTGTRAFVFGSAITLDPGRYWASLIYRVSTAPTTSPAFSLISAGTSMWGSAPGQVSRGTTTGSSLTAWPSSGTPAAASSVPAIGLRAA